MKTDPLFAIAADNWRNEVLVLNKYASYKTTTKIVDKLIREFGHLRISQIEKVNIQRFIVRMSGVLGVEYIRHLLSTFKGIMEYSDDNWEMPRRLKLPKKTKTRQDVFAFADARRVFETSVGQDRILWMLLAETGCRIGEALALQSRDIKDGVMCINKNMYEGVLQPTPKTDSSERNVCISDRLVIELEKLKLPNPTGFVFRTPTGRAAWPQQLCYSLKTSCEKAGVDYKAFHAFRRGNITELLINLQIPERIVGMRVGHESQGMTLGVYCKPTVGTDKVWVPRIAELLYGSD